MAAEGKYVPLTQRERRLTVSCAAALAVFYFLLRSRNHPIDSVLYALAVEVKDAYPFFHWHHLLYAPLGWLVINAAGALGHARNAFTVLAAFSAASAAAAAAFFYLALRRLGATFGGALLTVAVASLSAAWWYFAGEAEILAVISLFVAGGLYWLTAPKLGYKAVMGLACWLGVGTLFHQVVLLFVPFALVVIAWRRHGRWLRVLTFSSVYAPLVVVPYVLIPYFYYGIRGFDKWVRWATYYSSWGDWGHFTAERFGESVLTALAAVVAGPSPFDVWKAVPVKEFVKNYAPAVVVLAAVLGTVAAGAGRLWRQKRPWLIMAVAWFLCFHVFFSWWEPENAEWWIATLMPVWLLFGLAVPRGRAFYATAVVITSCAAALNFGRLVYPSTVPGKNDAEAAARTIVSATRPGDTIFISHLDVNAWTDYLSRHTRTLSAPFCRPAGDAASKLESSALLGFPEYTRNGGLFFTDFEWDDASMRNRAWANDMRVVFFKILRPAEPVTVLRFPGGERVLCRYKGYGKRIKDVRIYEAEGPDRGAARCVLATSGASVTVRFDVSEKGRYVLCVQASGNPALGVWPRMEVALDGVRLGGTAVDAPFPRFYECACDLAAGPHEVRLTFLNDYYDPATGANRDLFLNRLIVYQNEPTESNSGSE
jgi:hypothetical protein